MRNLPCLIVRRKNTIIVTGKYEFKGFLIDKTQNNLFLMKNRSIQGAKLIVLMEFRET